MNFGDSWSSKNSQSPLLRLGTGMDPLVALFPNLGDWKIKTGDKLQSWVSDNIAKKDPVIKMDRKYGLPSYFKEAKKVSDWAQEKPLDSTALILGGIFGGGALAGGLGGGGGGSAAAGGASGAGLGSTAAPATAASWGAPAGIEGVTVVGSSGAAMSPGTAAALQAAAASQAMNAQPQQQQGNFNWRDMLDNMPNQQQQQQQQEQQQASIPQRQATGARPVSWMDKIKSGLGQTGDRMFPIDQAYGLNPEQQKAMRKNALLQMGLGMMAASNRGAGFGEAAAFGLGQAQNNLTGALQRGYENARQARQEQRQEERDKASDERFDKTYERQVAAEERAEERDQRNFERQLQQDEAARARWEAQQEATARYRDQQLAFKQAGLDLKRGIGALGKPPAGYRWKEDGTLEAIEGGPATVIPAEAAGRLGMTEQAITAASDARKAFFTEDGKLDRSAVMAAATGAPWSEGRAAGQRVKVAVETALRLATGAAAPETEVDRYVDMYTPSVLDSDAAAKIKLDTLDDFIKNTNKYLNQGRGKATPVGGSSGGWSIQEVP